MLQSTYHYILLLSQSSIMDQVYEIALASKFVLTIFSLVFYLTFLWAHTVITPVLEQILLT